MEREPTGGQDAIRIRDLCKVYRTVRGEPREALRGLCLQVRPGEIYGFLGPNGAGKSTTLKILVGLVEATSGEAEIFGHPAGSVEARRRLGFLPETAVYHELLTVREVLELHAGLAGVPRGEVRRLSDEALELVGLAWRASSRVRELSKGMKQRLGIAQAVVARPALLILDELTSGLDPVAQEELKGIILSLKARGITLLFSSHHLEEVEAVADRVGILHKGRLLLEGPLQELLRQADLVTVAFSGEAARRRLEEAGRAVEARGGGLCVPVEAAGLDALLADILSAGGSIRAVEPPRVDLHSLFFQTLAEDPS